MSSDVVHHRLAGNLAVQMHTLAAMIVNENNHKVTIFADRIICEKIKAHLVAHGVQADRIKCAAWPSKEPQGVTLRIERSVSHIRAAIEYGLEQSDGIVFVTRRSA